MSDLSDLKHSLNDRSLENPLGKCLEFQLHVEKLLGIRNVTSFVVWKKLAGSLLFIDQESTISFVEDRIRRMEPDVDFYTLLEAGRLYSMRFSMQEKANEYHQKAKITAGECVQTLQLKNMLREVEIKERNIFEMANFVDDQFIFSHSLTMNQYYDNFFDKIQWDEQVFIYVLVSRKLGQYALNGFNTETCSLAAGICGNALKLIEKLGGKDTLIANISSLKARLLAKLKTEESTDESIRLLLNSWNFMKKHLNNNLFCDHHYNYAIYFLDKTSSIFERAKKYVTFLEFLFELPSKGLLPIEKAYVSTKKVLCYTCLGDNINALKYMEESEIHLLASKTTYDSDELLKDNCWYRITETLRNQALSYQRLENLSKSEEKFIEAIQILLLVKGENHYRVLWFRTDLVKLYLTWKKPRLAQSQLDKIKSNAHDKYRYGNLLLALQCRIDRY